MAFYRRPHVYHRHALVIARGAEAGGGVGVVIVVIKTVCLTVGEHQLRTPDHAETERQAEVIYTASVCADKK